MKTGESEAIGRASSYHVAVAADRVARFRGKGLTVTNLQGVDLFSVEMPYDDEHHCLCFLPDGRLAVSTGAQADMALADVRSEERRVGKGCVSTCRSRGSAYH